MLVRVAHNEADRTACRLALEDTAEQFHVVCLIACCRNVALTRTPTVQLLLDEVDIDVDAGRHTVNNTANGLTMALTKGG